MKKFYFGLVSAVLFALVGCVQEPTDGPLTPGVEDDGNSVYLDVAMALPSAGGTRSQTDNENEDKSDSTGDGQTPSDANPDYEYAYDYENDVRTLILVIATDESSDGAGDGDKYIAHSVVNGLLQTPTTGQDFNFTAAAKFKRSDIATAYEAGGLLANSKKVRLYAFCNYTQDLFNKFEALTKNSGVKTWLDWAGKVEEETGNKFVNETSPIWANRAFLMSNAEIKVAEFPASIEKWNSYTSESKPFHLSDRNENNDPDNSLGATAQYKASPIKVERTAARIDFRDGSEKPDGKANTYKLTGKYYTCTDAAGSSPSTEPQDVNLFNITLTEMSLVNMSKEFYYLRRVSADGTNTNWKIGKYETKTNYVVDTDYEYKSKPVEPSSLAAHFSFPLFLNQTVSHSQPSTISGSNGAYKYNTAGWFTSKITDVLNGNKDNWTGTNGSTYKIWRYVTENTIPQDPAPEEQPEPAQQRGNSGQKTGHSVGIVFKGQIVAGTDIAAYYAATNSEGETIGKRFASENVENALKGTGTKYVLYMYNGLMYAGFDEFLAEAYIDGAGSPAHNAATDILSNWYVEGTGKEFKYYATAPEGEATQLTVEIYYTIKNVQEAEKENVPEDLQKYVASGYTITLAESYVADNETTNAQVLALKNAATKNGFSIYEADTDGNYYCYYFYWNRHNNNGNNALMGPMEFATVRNNVYKLAVTTIGRIGHPTIPENDPDPIDPDDPDEEDVVYMDVQIEVLPWVVRVNDIEF